MIQLIYVSSAVEELSREELRELLDQSREKNKRLNITGMLLYSAGNFIQVLEGEQTDVESVYTDILKDARNHGHLLLSKEPISTRDFPKWSMGFRDISIDESQNLEGFSAFLQKDLAPAEFANYRSTVVDLLYGFKQNNR